MGVGLHTPCEWDVVGAGWLPEQRGLLASSWGDGWYRRLGVTHDLKCDRESVSRPE